MSSESSLRLANLFRTIARVGLLVIGVVVFGFALIMGADFAGEGIGALITNAPNALPWAILLGLVWLAWKQELIGGILVTLTGIGLVIFFNSGPNFWLSTFIMTLLIPVLGIGFLASWWLRRDVRRI